MEYWVKFDIELFFCESPPISPVVRRTLRDTLITQVWVTPLREPIPNFERWIDIVTNDFAKDVHRMSIIEMGGLRDCGMAAEDNYIITVTDKGFTTVPPVVPRIKRTLIFKTMFRCSKETGRMTDGVVFRYKDYDITEESEEFPQSLTMWRDEKLEDTIREFREKCKNIDRELYDYDIIDVEVSEE